MFVLQAILERIETINHLNQQLHDCQRQYTDVLTTKSMDTFTQTDMKRQLTRINDEKNKLEQTCEDLQVVQIMINSLLCLPVRSRECFVTFHSQRNLLLIRTMSEFVHRDEIIRSEQFFEFRIPSFMIQMST
jgi:hypothetical protein